MLLAQAKPQDIRILVNFAPLIQIECNQLAQTLIFKETFLSV